MQQLLNGKGGKAALVLAMAMRRKGVVLRDMGKNKESAAALQVHGLPEKRET